MTDLVSEMRRAYDLKGDTYSSMEVFGMLSRGAAEIERLHALVLDACKVFDHYDLPEHAFHYRRAILGLDDAKAISRAAIHKQGERS